MKRCFADVEISSAPKAKPPVKKKSPAKKAWHMAGKEKNLIVPGTDPKALVNVLLQGAEVERRSKAATSLALAEKKIELFAALVDVLLQEAALAEPPKKTSKKK